MSVWLAAPVCLLIALCALPVRFGLLKSPGGLTLGLLIGPFRAQKRLSLAQCDAGPALCLDSPGHHRILPLLPMLKTDPRAQPGFRPALSAAKYLLGQIRPDRINLDLTIDTGDACRTVLAAAAVSSALNALTAVRPGLPVSGRLRCSFNRKGELHALGIFSCRVGHIMLAALIFGREYLIRRKKNGEAPH